jgi:hypothetical protein
MAWKAGRLGREAEEAVVGRCRRFTAAMVSRGWAPKRSRTGWGWGEAGGAAAAARARPRPFPRFTEEREVSEEVRKEQIATEGLPPAAS